MSTAISTTSWSNYKDAALFSIGAAHCPALETLVPEFKLLSKESLGAIGSKVLPGIAALWSIYDAIPAAGRLYDQYESGHYNDTTITDVLKIGEALAFGVSLFCTPIAYVGGVLAVGEMFWRALEDHSTPPAQNQKIAKSEKKPKEITQNAQSTPPNPQTDNETVLAELKKYKETFENIKTSYYNAGGQLSTIQTLFSIPLKILMHGDLESFALDWNKTTAQIFSGDQFLVSQKSNYLDADEKKAMQAVTNPCNQSQDNYTTEMCILFLGVYTTAYTPYLASPLKRANTPLF